MGKGAFALFLLGKVRRISSNFTENFLQNRVDKMCGLWYNVGTVKETILNIEKVVTYYDY